MCKENSEKLNVFEQIEDVTCITNWLEKELSRWFRVKWCNSDTLYFYLYCCLFE